MLPRTSRRGVSVGQRRRPTGLALSVPQSGGAAETLPPRTPRCAEGMVLVLLSFAPFFVRAAAGQGARAADGN